MTFDAIILTGGRGSRLGGADKASLDVGGRTLLERSLAAARGAETIVVVGPDVDVEPGVIVTRENPPGGGPVAGIAAGTAALPSQAGLVLVLACDMPFAAESVPALLAAVGDYDGAQGVDDGGRLQPLLAVYRADALAGAIAALDTPHGAPMRALTRGMNLADVPVGRAARDADTWDDVESLREEWS